MSGLNPRTVTVEEGRHEIRFENPTVQAELELQIDDARGLALARTAKRPGEKFRVKKQLLMNLAPGVYTARVVGQPLWTSTIVVRPKVR